MQLLEKKGFAPEDARDIIAIVSKPEHRDFFVDYMMIEELGLEIPDDPWGPLKDGTVTLISFMVFGSIPMWVYLILWAAKYENHGGIFGVACAATVITLFCLGYVRA